MNKTFLALLGTGIIAIAAVGGFLLVNKKDSSKVAAPEQPNDTSTIESDASSSAAGTSLTGSDGTKTSDTPSSEDSGEQNANYTIDLFNFGFSIEQIKAAPGDTITIELTNSGGTHNFVIDELNVQSDTINTGGNALVTFTIPPDAAGKTFEYYCSLMNHRAQGMVGQLVISE